MREAQNLLALSKAETPLKGGENTPLHPTSFDGLMPTKHVPQTPNSVMVRRRRCCTCLGHRFGHALSRCATNFGVGNAAQQLGTPGRAANISATPFRGSTGAGTAVAAQDGVASGALLTPCDGHAERPLVDIAAVAGTPLRTPLRDELAINPVDDTESLVGGATPGSVRSTTQVRARAWRWLRTPVRPEGNALSSVLPQRLLPRALLHPGVPAPAAAQPAGDAAQAAQRV